MPARVAAHSAHLCLVRGLNGSVQVEFVDANRQVVALAREIGLVAGSVYDRRPVTVAQAQVIAKLPRALAQGDRIARSVENVAQPERFIRDEQSSPVAIVRRHEFITGVVADVI